MSPLRTCINTTGMHFRNTLYVLWRIHCPRIRRKRVKESELEGGEEIDGKKRQDQKQIAHCRQEQLDRQTDRSNPEKESVAIRHIQVKYITDSLAIIARMLESRRK